MTATLTLPFGLVAQLEESDDDRPAPLAPPPAEHLWLACGCADCHARRLAVSLASGEV